MVSGGIPANSGIIGGILAGEILKLVTKQFPVGTGMVIWE